MAAPTRKYNPGFLSDDEIIASFCVRTNEFASLVEMLRECTGTSNPHQLVIGPRGSGKTSLLRRVAAEIGRDGALSANFFPVVFAEESYEVSTAGEFWLECLSRLAVQAPRREGSPDLHRTYDELRTIDDDQTLEHRCLTALLDFADREGKRLVLMVENLNMMFRDMVDQDAGWRLRKVLQTEPRIVLLASATSRFDQIDHPDQALYDQFRVLPLRPLDTQECAVLWKTVSGHAARPETIRSLQILTGGDLRLVVIVARFGAGRSFRNLMANLLDLVDDHTEYFKGHIELLPAQERRVYLALAELWKPATTKEIADRSRVKPSPCSAQLTRLVERGIVEVAGGTARRKQYYLTQRLYNIYYLLRRPRGPDRLVEALIRFMEAFYAPHELRDIGVGMAREADNFDGEMRFIEHTLIEKASFELEHHRYEAAIRTAGLVLEQCRAESLENRARGHLIRARAALENGDPSGCEQDIEAFLALLPELGSLAGEPLVALMEFSIELGPAHMRELIQGSPAAPLLLPLTTALEQELGLETRVAREVDEVAQDIREKLENLRSAKRRDSLKTEEERGLIVMSGRHAVTRPCAPAARIGLRRCPFSRRAAGL